MTILLDLRVIFNVQKLVMRKTEILMVKLQRF